MTEPWTPGPWEVDEFGYVTLANGEEVASRVVNPADARLIAAAPEMAEFVRRFVENEHDADCFEGRGGPDAMVIRDYCSCFDDIAEPLLARIRGEDTENP